jgi:hypothetical protein
VTGKGLNQVTLNNFEEATLRQLAYDVVALYADDEEIHEVFIPCPWCLWRPSEITPHNCILLDVYQIVKSWETDDTLGAD